MRHVQLASRKNVRESPAISNEFQELIFSGDHCDDDINDNDNGRPMMMMTMTLALFILTLCT